MFLELEFMPPKISTLLLFLFATQHLVAGIWLQQTGYSKKKWCNFVSPSTENSMNCNENNWIAFSDVRVLTYANEMSFSLTHARACQHFVAVVALDIAWGNLLSASEECLACFYPWIHSGAAFIDVYQSFSHAAVRGCGKNGRRNSLLIKKWATEFLS